MASENIRRELKDIEARIEDLREVLYELDAGFCRLRGDVGWLGSLRVCALRTGLRRQIRELVLRREVARNCLAEACRYEGWLLAREEGRKAFGCPGR